MPLFEQFIPAFTDQEIEVSDNADIRISHDNHIEAFWRDLQTPFYQGHVHSKPFRTAAATLRVRTFGNGAFVAVQEGLPDTPPDYTITIEAPNGAYPGEPLNITGGKPTRINVGPDDVDYGDETWATPIYQLVIDGAPTGPWFTTSPITIPANLTGGEELQVQDYEGNISDPIILLPLEGRAFFSRLAAQGLTLSQPRQDAYNTFFVSGHNNGWLAHVIEMHPFEGSTLAQVAVKLAYRQGNPSSLVNNGYLVSYIRPQGGLLAAGNTVYWSTINANSLGGPLFGLNTWMREPMLGSTALMMGLPNSASPTFSMFSAYSAVVGQSVSCGSDGASFNPGVAVGRGMYSLRRSSLSSLTLRINGDLAATSSTVTVGNLRDGAIRVAQAPCPVDFGAIDDGLMTPTQNNAFYLDVNALMIALGRIEAMQDTNALLIIGQSLAIGQAGSPSLSRSLSQLHRAPFRGTISSVLTDPAFAFGALFEGATETIASSMARTMGTLHRAAVPGDFSRDLTISNWGVGGQTYQNLKKGTAPYTNSINSLISMRDLHAETLLGTFDSECMAVVHGEADYNTARATYFANLIQWQIDYETDINATLGRVGTVKMLHSQPSSWTVAATTAQSPYAILDAYEAHPDKIVLVCAKYFLTHAVDKIHLINTSYRLLGDYYGKALHAVLKGQTFSPLRPTSIVRVGSVITVSFAGRVGNLVLDTTLVSDPGNYGFEWAQTGGSVQTISSVALVNGNTQLQITLSGDPGNPSAQILRYAYTGVNGNSGGPTTGPRGCVRDSDPTVGAGSGLNLYNWLVHFDKPVT